MKKGVLFFGLMLVITAKMLILAGCAGIIPPSGGPRDTIPPKLLVAFPKDSATYVKSQKIVLSFDEFVELKDFQQNVLVSPNPVKSPLVDYKLKTITIKLRDSLEPNTTYSINFGNAIKDINEGNVFKEFTYTFSTGATLADGTFSGKVVLAETGKYDSTLIVVLHNTLHDTAIYKKSPRYLAKVTGQGLFAFKNIAPGKYNAFVLPNDYSKKYDDSTKLFAFLDSTITISNTTPPATFYAYEEVKRKEKAPASNNNKGKDAPKEDKRLKYMTSLESNQQDLLTPLTITFNRKLKLLDSSKITLCDTFYNPLPDMGIQLDTTSLIATLSYPWKAATDFRLVIEKQAAKDTNGAYLPKGDTLKFTTRNEADYGSIKVRFKNIDLKKHPVLQIVSNDKIQESVPLKDAIFKRKLFKPGDYMLRILLDENQNGVWDTGNFSKRLQPERVLEKTWKLNVKANWDNEMDISL
ncbi:Ig-like domain-containing protein [Parasediminibacterium sp. JCM 36343]|uniref:Ig-like domain-containing protein n=1 Tax=Parasediminibacterium sp. JCM 36343 TaxID=3374279 RepID=UPI003978F380